MGCVTRLNLLKLAPGGNFGRFVIWTQGAFKKLGEMYGTLKSGAPMKKGYRLPRAQMENADLDRIINSTEVQSVLRQKLEPKANALKNKAVMSRLNPAAEEESAKRRKAHEKGTKEHGEVQASKKARVAASKEHNKKHKKGDESFY